MLEIKIVGKTIETITPEVFVRGTVGEKVAISCDEEWGNRLKTVVFKRLDSCAEPIVNYIGAVDETEIDIPHEILHQSGQFYIGLYSVMGSETTPTLWSEKFNIEYGTDTDGIAPQPPTPSEYSQLIQLAEETKEIANSVREDADNGVFDGEKGEKGEDGQDYILTDADKQEIAGMVEIGNTPTSDNWCVIANTTLTENIGSATANQKFFEVTTDINGNPLAEKNIRHLRMTFYFPTSEDALYHGWQVRMSTNGSSVVNTKCDNDSYFGCQVDVMNKNAAFVVRPAGTSKSYNENNFVLAGAHFQERSGLFGGKDKIEGIYFYTNYPNGTILPVGTKIMITGW